MEAPTLLAGVASGYQPSAAPSSPPSQAAAHCPGFCGGPPPRPLGALGPRSPPPTWARGLSPGSARHTPASPHTGLSPGPAPQGSFASAAPCDQPAEAGAAGPCGPRGSCSPDWGLAGGNLGLGRLAPPGLPRPSGRLLVHRLWGLPGQGLWPLSPFLLPVHAPLGSWSGAPPSACTGASADTAVPPPAGALGATAAS